MSQFDEHKVPAELIEPIRKGLIALGYATDQTTDEAVQDAYFKYVIIRQTGFNPNMPYALGLLPKEIQDQLEGVEPPVEPPVGEPVPFEVANFATPTRIQFMPMPAGGVNWTSEQFGSGFTSTFVEGWGFIDIENPNNIEGEVTLTSVDGKYKSVVKTIPSVGG